MTFTSIYGFNSITLFIVGLGLCLGALLILWRAWRIERRAEAQYDRILTKLDQAEALHSEFALWVGAVKTLEKIAAQDYRGNVPAEQVLAREWLVEHGVWSGKPV